MARQAQQTQFDREQIRQGALEHQKLWGVTPTVPTNGLPLQDAVWRHNNGRGRLTTEEIDLGVESVRGRVWEFQFQCYDSEDELGNMRNTSFFSCRGDDPTKATAEAIAMYPYLVFHRLANVIEVFPEEKRH